MLYKCGNEWMQRNENHLDIQSLVAIGKCIDEIHSENLIVFKSPFLKSLNFVIPSFLCKRVSSNDSFAINIFTNYFKPQTFFSITHI